MKCFFSFTYSITKTWYHLVIVRADTMACERRLRLGYYPVLNNAANTGVTSDINAHVLETGKINPLYIL